MTVKNYQEMLRTVKNKILGNTEPKKIDPEKLNLNTVLVVQDDDQNTQEFTMTKLLIMAGRAYELERQLKDLKDRQGIKYDELLQRYHRLEAEVNVKNIQGKQDLNPTQEKVLDYIRKKKLPRSNYHIPLMKSLGLSDSYAYNVIRALDKAGCIKRTANHIEAIE